MTHSVMHDQLSAVDCGAEIMADADEFGKLLGPVVAGARAAGVADAFEMMGLAAVLIDRAGRVLHAGGRAQRTLQPWVRIVGDHLVGTTGEANERLQRLIEFGLGGEGVRNSCQEVELADSDGWPRLSMKAIRFPQGGDRSVQLLQAIIVVTKIGA